MPQKLSGSTLVPQLILVTWNELSLWNVIRLYLLYLEFRLLITLRKRFVEIKHFMNISYMAVLWPNLGHYLRDSLFHTTFISAFCLVLIRRSPEASWWDWVPKPSRAPSEGWTWNLPILQQQATLTLTHKPTLPKFPFSKKSTNSIYPD